MSDQQAVCLLLLKSCNEKRERNGMSIVRSNTNESVAAQMGQSPEVVVSNNNLDLDVEDVVGRKDFGTGSLLIQKWQNRSPPTPDVQ
jgi:hypothetical protein